MRPGDRPTYYEIDPLVLKMANASPYFSYTVTVIAARSDDALKAFRADPRWRSRDPGEVQAWTDDYTNLIGAFLAHKES